VSEEAEGKTSVELGLSVTLSATARVRMNFSFLHLMSAARFSQAVGQLEQEHANDTWGPFFEAILANASSSVLLAVAGLEAFANELFIDHSTYLPTVSRELVAHLWHNYERSTVLDKLDLALLLAGRPRLPRGDSPMQDVDALNRLRNALTHFKPEWTDEADEHARLSARLRGRFAPTPFLPDSEPIFPRRWASHGCTAWAVQSVVELIRVVESFFPGDSRAAQFASRLVG
jgi:hypothetical protein